MISKWNAIYNKEPIENDIYLKCFCFYQAKTELYDRALTDERSPHDPTEAYINDRVRSYSNRYSYRLYGQVTDYVTYRTGGQFDADAWGRAKRHRLSAQGWIDLFERLKSENDEIILDMCEKIKMEREL